MGWDSPDQDYEYLTGAQFEPQAYFVEDSCTCEHEPPQHCFLKCDVEGCPCTGHWEE